LKLVNISIKRPVGVIMFVICAIILGFISLRDLKVELFPKMDLPVAVIATSYQGAAPQEVEELISKPIETAVSTVEGIDTLQSVSNQGASLVLMMFDYDRDIDEALIDVREKVDQISDMLPDGANDPMVMRLDPNAAPIMIVSLSGKNLEKLQAIAESDVQPALERAPGVASAAISGGKEREIRVNLNQAMLKTLGITGNQVIAALQAENRTISAGTVEQGNQDVQLRVVGEYTSIADIENTLIPLNSGDTVRLKDVAEVEDTFKEVSAISRVNGEDTLVFTIMKQSDANSVETAEEVQKVIKELNEKYKNQGIEVKTILDTSVYITSSIDSVISNMIVGGTLAAIILLLFLRSVKATLVIAVSMPISIISTFILMYFTGETLNIISMGGLALGIGMMVDSSIVILENIYKKRSEGLSIKDAAFEGASELGPAVIASTLTTAVVFVPVVFVEGLTAQIFRPLALTVVFSLTASLIAAITLVPMLSTQFMRNVQISLEDDATYFFNRFLSKVKNVYGRVLEKALHRRKTVISIVSVVFIGSLALIPVVGMELMPSTDSGQVSINATLENGAQLEETEAVVNEIDQRLKKFEDIIDVSYVNIGGSNNGIMAGSKNTASYMIKLVGPSDRDMTTDEFVAEISDLVSDIPGAEITVSQNDYEMSTGSPITISISGDNLDVLKDLSQQVVWMLEEIEGTLNVESTVEEGSPEVQVVVNRDLASAYGLSYQQIMNEINVAFNGQVATLYKEGGHEYDVRVTLPDSQKQSVRDLEAFVVRNNQGENIPLSAVAELKIVQGPSQIMRNNQERTINVTSDVMGRDLGTVSQEIEEKLEQLHLPDGYEISIGGEVETMMESFIQLALVLALGIFLVYMVMAVQFESFSYPLIIMFSVPTMAIGIVLGLLITGLPFSLPAFIGVIMLAGIVVNNGILLVEYINILRRQDMERMEAIMEAGKSRLRPILMTTLTTVLGMIPLALAIGEGAENQQPMAVVVVFGLTSSTIFTLVFVPVMYVVIDNLSDKFRKFYYKGQSEKSDHPKRRAFKHRKAKNKAVKKELEAIGNKSK